MTARSFAVSRANNERKRSVTFEHEQVGLKKNTLALNLADENDEKTEAGVDPITTYREEGQRILDDAVEKVAIGRRLEEQSMMNGELRDLYEMQLFEQRKLQETINDVKKQVLLDSTVIEKNNNH